MGEVRALLQEQKAACKAVQECFPVLQEVNKEERRIKQP